MRRALLCCAAIIVAIACGDYPTEVVPDRAPAAPAAAKNPMIAFATTTTEDGLSISTDKDDYQPGDTVHFTGYGWQPGDVLDIVLTDDPLTHDPHTWSVNVEADGMFHDTTYVVDEGDLNVSFTLVATSRSTGRSLTVQFTDGNPGPPTAGPQSPNPVVAGGTATYTVTVNFVGNSDVCTVVLTAAPTASPSWPAPPPGGFFSFAPTSLTSAGGGGGGINLTSTLTVNVPASTASNTYKFRVTADQDADAADCQGNNEESADISLVVQANAPANTPATLAQFRSNGTTPIPTGGATNETSVVLKGVVSDPNAGNTVKLQVEVKPVGTAFTNTSTAESALLASGSTAAVTVTGLVNGTSYHWQARAVDNNGAASAWTSFGGNAETDADFLVDTDAPGVTINQAVGQADPTNASPINFTVVFSKPVTGFATGDVTLSGTAGATTATVTGSGANYNVAVSGMATDGTVIATIAAAVATDAAGNDNVASTSTDNTVTYDTTKPTVTIDQAAGQADPTNASPINFTVVFNESVADFATGDVTLSGTAGATTATVTGSGTTYNVAVSGMTTDGTVIASIAASVAHDAAGNPNTASTSTDHTVTYDNTPPTVTINQAAGQADPTNASPINFTVVFNETVADFATGDVTLSGTAGATTATVTGSGMNYNVAVSGMTGGGTVIASIAAGVATDAAGNGNAASTSTDHTVTYDPQPPAVSDVAVSPNPTNGSIDVHATATVDDALTGNSRIVSAFYRINGGTEVAMDATDGSFSSATEEVQATIPASVVAGLGNGNHTVCVRGTDEAGNSSDYADPGACVTLRVDNEPPIVSNVSVSPNPTNGSVAVTATAKVDDGSTGSSKITSAFYKIDGEPEVSMAASDAAFDEVAENVTASIPAGVVAALDEGDHDVCVRGTDAAGNTSSYGDAGACTTLTIDKTPPEVTINQASGQADPTNTGPINFTVVFTETVTDFATGDVTLSGSAGATTATVTGSGVNYNVAVSGMATDGTVIASLAASVAHDAAGNGNNASTSTDNTVTYDITPPKVTINQAAAQADPTKTSPINFTVVFDETVTGFATGDVTLGGTAGATTAVVSGSGTTYNVAVSGMTSNGTVIATVGAAVAKDAAGNDNEASTSTDNTVTYDTTPPAISNFAINPNPVAVNTPFTISATFTDALSFVTGAEYSLNGATGPWNTLPAAGGTAPYGNSQTENGSITLNRPDADVLNVCVRSTDQALNTNQIAGTNPIQCTFLAVYDPSAGFVTGGGWINSPAGAYPADASLIGKANFGFVSKYIAQKDKTTPVLTGNTEFQFHAGSLNFSSTVYDWMVVQGSTKASYKGSGTVNGVAGYGFLLSVVDGGSTGDKFRMKIWNKATSAIVYDNQLSAADDATASQLIAGGSIVIHTNGGLANK